MVKTSLFPSTYDMLKKKKKKEKEEPAVFQESPVISSPSTLTPTSTNIPGSIVTDSETGKPKGFINSKGQFVKAGKDDIALQNQKRAEEAALLEGQTTTEQIGQQQSKQQILSQLGQVTGVSQERLNELIEQYGLSGATQFQEGLPGALREGTTQAVSRGLSYGGAAAGAGLLGGPAAPVTVPVAAAIGVAAGVISGYWSALRKAKKSEAKEDVGNAMAEFQQIRRGLSQVGSLTSSGLINEVEAVELYNAQLTRMLEIEAQVKYLQDTNLKDYLSDGSDDLAQISTYLTQVAPAYKMRIQSSLMNPTAKVPYSDIILEDMASLE